MTTPTPTPSTAPAPTHSASPSTAPDRAAARTTGVRSFRETTRLRTDGTAGSDTLHEHELRG